MKAFHILMLAAWPLVLLVAILVGTWLGQHFGSYACVRSEERLEMEWNPALGIPTLVNRRACIVWVKREP